MRKKIIIGILLINSPILGQEQTIKITGNERSSTQYIEQIFKKCLVQHQNDYRKIPEITQCVKNTKLFSNVNITNTNQEWIVEVTDKWTLIPLPFFITSSNGRWSTGLFAIESNFLGKGKFLLLGGIYGNSGNTLMLMYQDKNIAFSPWRLNINFQKSSSVLKYSTQHDIDSDSFKENRIVASNTLGYELFDNIFTSLSFTYSNRKYTQEKMFTAPNNLTDFKIGTNLHYKNTNYKLFFDEGTTIDATYYSQIWKNDHSQNAQAFLFDTTYGLELSNTSLVIKTKLNLTNTDDKRDLLKLGAKEGYRGFAGGSLWVKKSIALALDYQVPVWLTTIGTLTIAPFVDIGRFEGDQNRYISYVTEGIGTYFYLNKVSIPGMGFVLGYNHHLKQTNFSFSIGMGE